MLALSGILALSVDVGNSFMVRRELQIAADAAAMAGGHLALEQIMLTPPLTDYPKQRAAALQFARLNGMIPADTIQIDWVDGSGTVITNDVNGLPVPPPGTTVQGMKVTLSGSRSTYLFSALGIPGFQVSVSAVAQFGTPNGLVGAIPLALNCDSIPPAGPCPPSAGPAPTLYAPVVMTTQSGGPACPPCPANDSLGRPIPAAFAAPLGPANFFSLHDPPTSAAGLATRQSTHLGLKTTLSLGVPYYVEDGKPVTTEFAQGLNDRILDSINNPAFNGDRPAAGAFSPINPRVFMVSINRAAGDTPCGAGFCVTLDEYLAFWLQFVLYDPANPGAGVTIGGYFVLSTGVPGGTGFGNPNAPGPKIFRLTA
jgi:hypothetical protein